MDILNQRFVKDPNLVTRCISGETIIVPIRSGVGELDSIYTLNEVGTAVWQLIDGQADTQRIIESIAGEYEVERKEAVEDVLALLRGLEAARLVRAEA